MSPAPCGQWNTDKISQAIGSFTCRTVLLDVCWPKSTRHGGWSCRGMGGAVSRTFSGIPFTFVRDVRATGPGRLGVLLATPRQDWRQIPFNARTNEGFWDRLETVLQIVDTGSARVVSSYRVEGTPVSISSDSTFATYREAADGTPVVTIWKFSMAGGR